jgi:hypothetical protein
VLRAAGLDPIPELRGEGVRSWFDVSAQVAEQAARYGLAEPFYFLAPREGFTLGDYLLARHLGGRPIQPGCVLESCASRDARELHRGEVVAATLEAGSGDRARLLAEIDRLERAGLAITSVRELALGVPPS